MKFHPPLNTFEVIKMHHNADSVGCTECFDDHCGVAHPEREDAVLMPNPEGCSICWLIDAYEKMLLKEAQCEAIGPACVHTHG